MNVLTSVAAGAAIIMSVPAVQGHGFIVDPAAQWVDGYPSNGYGSTIKSNVLGTVDNSKFGYGPSGTVKFIEATLVKKGYDSLSALVAKNQELYSNKIDPSCGLTVYKDSARSDLPSELTFSGFTHPGPCEVWCDDTKVVFDSDCQTKFSGSPAKMSYEQSECANANRLTIYWIAVQGDPWQVYTDCVWLTGGSGSGAAPGGGGGGGGTSTVDSSGSASSSTTNNSSPSTSTTRNNSGPSTSTTSGNSNPSTSTVTTAPSPNTMVSTPSTNSTTRGSTTTTTAPPTSYDFGASVGGEADGTTTTQTSSLASKCSRRRRN